MDRIDLKAKLTEDVIEYVNTIFPKSFNERYFSEAEPRIASDKTEDLLIAGFGHVSSDDSETWYTNDQFCRSSLAFNFHLEESADYGEWIELVPEFSCKFRLPATPPIHRDVLKWERYETDEGFSGKLKWADEDLLDDEVGFWDGIQLTIRETCTLILDQHLQRSDEVDLDRRKLQQLSPADWERIRDMPHSDKKA